MSTTKPLTPANELSPALATARDYVLHFYPLWFSCNQFQHAPHNRFFGPVHISSIFQSVVAVNDDTLYAIAFFDLSVEPVVLTVPESTVTYSVLTMDAFGNIFASGIPTGTPGHFVLTGPNYSGTAPEGTLLITMPAERFIMIIRADKFSASGVDQVAPADIFRSSLTTQLLCKFQGESCPEGSSNNAEGGSALILPETAFALSFKKMADELIASDPVEFLKQLQTAVASPFTPTLSAEENELSSALNDLLEHVNAHNTDLASGTQAAHSILVTDYLTHKIPGTQWIHFTNIGDWGDAILDRAAIAEFILYGNGISTASYYQTFHDASGKPLDGNKSAYILTFPEGQLPEAERFWSVTAYTPETIELIDNPTDKYVVASYTPGLAKNADGSISIFMATELPPGVAAANWLPISSQPFNLLLRVYGPEGTVANNTYVPPAVHKLQPINRG